MFRESSRFYSLKRQNSKNSSRYTVAQRNYRKKKSPNAKRGGADIQIFKKNYRWRSRRDKDILIWPGYAYGQLPLLKNANDLCIFAVTGGNFTGWYRFLKGFYGLADIPTIFQEKIDKALENKLPAWLDDILVVTQGPKEQQKRELIDVLTKLENPGYTLIENKTNFFKPDIEWEGHKSDQNGIRPLQDKLRAIQELKEPQNEKELKSFSEAIQYLSKYIGNLSTQTDLLRQLLKENNKWNWTTEHSEPLRN